MAAKVRSIPLGYETVIPHLTVKDGLKAIEFYKNAFGAVETCEHFTDPEGRVGHASLRIGNAQIMLADELPDMGPRSPQTLGGSPVALLIYVEDVDTQVQKAVAAGAKLVRPVENRFYGDRSGQIEDPFGHIWTLATHVEDISLEEIRKRGTEMFGKNNC